MTTPTQSSPLDGPSGNPSGNPAGSPTPNCSFNDLPPTRSSSPTRAGAEGCDSSEGPKSPEVPEVPEVPKSRKGREGEGSAARSGSDDAVLVHALNELVFVHQLVAASQWFNALVVASIVLAGALVGVQTYPAMAGDPSVAVVDWAVQAVFTLDCVVKIAQEGRAPWRFW